MIVISANDLPLVKDTENWLKISEPE